MFYLLCTSLQKVEGFMVFVGSKKRQIFAWWPKKIGPTSPHLDRDSLHFALSTKQAWMDT